VASSHIDIKCGLLFNAIFAGSEKRPFLTGDLAIVFVEGVYPLISEVAFWQDA
jgi:hypothetical protein